MTGTVAVWNEGQGWGFLRPDKPGPDAFVHYKFISSDGRHEKRKSLWVGQRVQYDVVRGERGYEARNVVVWSGVATIHKS